MIRRNTFSKLIVFILFVHIVLSALANSMFSKKNRIASCLSPLDNETVSQVNESKLKTVYDMVPISSYPVFDKPIREVKTEDKVISLSFDDGYNHDNILQILNILKENGNLKTTFFFCGNAIDSDEKLIEKEYEKDKEHSIKREHSVKVVYDNGHEIGNHSDSHKNFKKLSDESATNEVINCNEKIKNITGNYPVVFRFPYGAYNQNSLNVVRNLKMFPVQWSIDTTDWKKSSSSESIYNEIINNIHNGAIILMHTNGKHTPEALRRVIPRILELGYKIVPVSDLINKRY